MKEYRARRWARKRVGAYFLKNILNPVGDQNPMKVMYRALKTNAATIPQTNLAELIPGIDEVEVRVKYSPRGGGGTGSDMITLAQIVKFFDRQRIFEIGTFRGYTTFHLALNSSSEAQVYTLDLPASGASKAKLELTDLNLIQKPSSGQWFQNTECKKKITQLYGDSADFDYSRYQGKMDFVYIDGSHSYEYVLADSLSAQRLLGPHGIIAWHDYPNYPGVWACLEELSKSWEGTFRWIEGTALVIWQPI